MLIIHLDQNKMFASFGLISLSGLSNNLTEAFTVLAADTEDAHNTETISVFL